MSTSRRSAASARPTPTKRHVNTKSKVNWGLLAAKTGVVAAIVAVATAVPPLIPQVLTFYRSGSDLAAGDALNLIFGGLLIRSLTDVRWVALVLIEVAVLLFLSWKHFRKRLSPDHYRSLMIGVLAATPLVYLFLSIPCTRVEVVAEPTLKPWLDRMVLRFNFTPNNKRNLFGRYFVTVRYIASRKAKETLLHRKDYASLTTVASHQARPLDADPFGVDPFADPGFPDLNETPVLWIPVDEFWSVALADALASEDSRQRYEFRVRGTVDDDRQDPPLLTTQLGIIVRSSRFACIQQALATRYRGRTWQLLHDLASKGWAAIAHPNTPEWSDPPVFLHTDPTFSNSGLLVLALGYCAWSASHKDEDSRWCKAHPHQLPVENPAFLNGWIVPFEEHEFRDAGGNPFFPATTADILYTFEHACKDGNKGIPDLAFTYEASVLQHASSDIHMLYLQPGVTLQTRALVLHLTDNAGRPLVSREQIEGARAFRRSLLEDSAQAESFRYGWRSAKPGLSAGDTTLPASLLAAYRKVGYKPQPHVTPFPNAPATNNELTFLRNWARYRHYGSAYTRLRSGDEPL